MFQMPDRDEANAPQEQEEEEAPREKVLHVKLNPVTHVYDLLESEQEEADIVGVSPSFRPDEMEVMLARAYAHQYRVEVS